MDFKAGIIYQVKVSWIFEGADGAPLSCFINEAEGGAHLYYSTVGVQFLDIF
jgi:hypothetical protein